IQKLKFKVFEKDIQYYFICFPHLIMLGKKLPVSFARNFARPIRKQSVTRSSTKFDNNNNRKEYAKYAYSMEGKYALERMNYGFIGGTIASSITISVCEEDCFVGRIVVIGTLGGAIIGLLSGFFPILIAIGALSIPAIIYNKIQEKEN